MAWIEYSNTLFDRRASAYDYLRREKTNDSISLSLVELRGQVRESTAKVELQKAFAVSILKTKLQHDILNKFEGIKLTKEK